jgi:hypothetical protein
MRSLGTNRSLLRRLKSLEAHLQGRLPRTIYYGWVRSHSQDRIAARDLVPLNCQATTSPNLFWCEFEERN